MSFIDLVRKAIEVHGLLVSGDRVVVGLSGGADSVALLEILARLKPEYDLTLIPAHLNHRFRGGESDGDERFCREVAARHGLELVSEAVDLPALIGEQGLSPQAAA
ncbi:MAG: ATP-binding protein, partial [bacterium]|nr:ATP-binding protein [bacterium]